MTILLAVLAYGVITGLTAYAMELLKIGVIEYHHLSPDKQMLWAGALFWPLAVLWAPIVIAGRLAKKTAGEK